MRNRPTGITLIAIVYLILGVLSLLWSSLVFGIGGLGALIGGLFGGAPAVVAGVSGAWAGLLGVVTAIVQIAVGIGLLRLRRWAWYLALVAVVLTVIQGVVGVFGGGLFAFVCGCFGLLLPLAILVYLLRPGVRQAFGFESTAIVPSGR